MRLGAIILAGGRSSRMGEDKALLRWNGRTAVDKTFELARQTGATRVVIAGGDYGLPFVLDERAYGGPVGGINAGLAELAEVSRTIILAVDAPTIQLDDLQPLVSAETPGAIYTGLPLPMVIDRAAMPMNLPTTAPLMRLVDEAGLGRLTPAPTALARLRGANTPTEANALDARFWFEHRAMEVGDQIHAQPEGS